MVSSLDGPGDGPIRGGMVLFHLTPGISDGHLVIWDKNLIIIIEFIRMIEGNAKKKKKEDEQGLIFDH